MSLRRVILSTLLALTVITMGCGPTPEKLASKANYHYKLANNFFYDQNPQAAIKELYAVLEYAPQHARAHHLLGFIYFGRRDLTRALEHLRTAVAIEPDFDDAVANLGNLYLAMKQWEAATVYFTRLLEKPMYKTPYLAHNNLGWALYQLGRFEESRKHLEMGIFLNPKFCLAYNNLARLNAHLGETKLAVEHFSKAIKLCPQYAEPHYFLGRIHAGLASHTKAREHFSRCHELGPETPYGRRCGEAL
ncbi:MAG: tetratricopeptide repeat protein [Myxococcota bacterium]|nr:tetratricopeptide repeat protein [Myxococcota bacterium]